MILVVEADPKICSGLKDLLTSDGYRAATAKDEQAAVEIARRQPPDLILVCLGESPLDLVSAVIPIRERAELGAQVPIVVFCISAAAEGEEIVYENHIYVISPDNFNHLRSFLKRLLTGLSSTP